MPKITPSRLPFSPAIAGLLLATLVVPARAQPGADLHAEIDRRAAEAESRVVSWRRDIHRHPELSNRETRTAALVADHLRALGFDEVVTDMAHTGVVGRLVGGRPGPVVALRADMDGLPVTEEVDLPFASRARAEYNGEEVGVMHACGHDAHTAILMGAAEVLAAMRERIPGTIVFVFQPAEEGAPEGEEGGAALMLKEGLLDGPDAPEAIFGLHVWPGPPGQIGYRSGPALAAADWLEIVVTGRQTHGSSPWRGVDPITVAAQIITGLQTIPSRQLDITVAPAVVSVGSIEGGVRGNIIPDTVEMKGTIRTFDVAMREDLHRRIENTAERIAESAGATADVEIESYAPVTYNDPELTARMLASLRWAAGEDGVREMPLIMGAEDFSRFQERIPGFYFILGVNAEGVGIEDAAPNHSPLFFVNEDALLTGVRAMASVALDYLTGE